MVVPYGAPDARINVVQHGLIKKEFVSAILVDCVDMMSTSLSLTFKEDNDKMTDVTVAIIPTIE